MSQFSSFSAVRIFRWLHCLKLCRYTAVQHSNAPPPPWRRAWGRVEVPKAPMGWVRGLGRGLLHKKLIT